MVNENVQIVSDALAVGASNPLPVSVVPAKSTVLPLFGGAISASVAEADATVIDMTKYTRGALSFLVNSGAGTFSCAFYGSDIATGTFKAMHQAKKDGSGTEAKPALVTTTTVSAMYEINGINCKYLKIVPTLTSTCNATFAFTPSV
jgi:hypothetical protein